MPITIDYIEPPAIVRRHKESMGPQAQGEFGTWLDECIAKISGQLDASREWKGVRDASANLSEEETDDPLEGLDLKLMPPNKTYTAQAHFYYAGRGEPLPFDFSDYFDDEDEE